MTRWLVWLEDIEKIGVKECCLNNNFFNSKYLLIKN